MMRPSVSLFPVLAALLLSACQSAAPTGAAETPAAVTAPADVAPSSARSEAEARAAVAYFVRQQPNAGLYQLEAASVLDVENQWQVLVPRTDWAERMPNNAAFEVDKQTGAVRSLPVK